MVDKETNNNIIVDSGTSSNIETLKIAILGDQFVGKTSILSKFQYDSVEDCYKVQI